MNIFDQFEREAARRDLLLIALVFCEEIDGTYRGWRFKRSFWNCLEFQKCSIYLKFLGGILKSVRTLHFEPVFGTITYNLIRNNLNYAPFRVR